MKDSVLSYSDEIWLGVDYGARYAGTTAVVWCSGDRLQISQSQKKEDVDSWLPALVLELSAKWLFIDAPLSLPSAYRPELQGDDYMYRQCDRELKAMSPMFLGGLTARAMQLASGLASRGVLCMESYPAALARELYGGMPWKKKDKVGEEQLAAFAERLLSGTGLQLARPLESPHEADALLAWWSGWRYHRGEHLSFGEEKEGLVIV